MPDLQIGSTRFWGHASREDFLNDVAAAQERRERVNARTLKWWSEAQANTAAGGIFVPLPEAGYDWNLKLVSAQLSASATLQAFIASSAPSTGSTPLRLISNFGAAATSQVATWSSSQVYLRRSEGLWLLPSAGTINAWFVTAEQVMAEMAYKAYD